MKFAMFIRTKEEFLKRIEQFREYNINLKTEYLGTYYDKAFNDTKEMPHYDLPIVMIVDLDVLQEYKEWKKGKIAILHNGPYEVQSGVLLREPEEILKRVSGRELQIMDIIPTKEEHPEYFL